jgi:MraZ protein
MAADRHLVLGEFRRALDDRYRLSIPAELADLLPGAEVECILAKERPGALSLWSSPAWGDRLQSSIRLVEAKIEAGRLAGRIDDVQRLGRLLSTRHRQIQLAGRSRLVIPEGFREFLGVEPGGDVLLVGAAVCVEIWRPEAWVAYLEQHMPEFGQLLNELSG